MSPNTATERKSRAHSERREKAAAAARGRRRRKKQTSTAARGRGERRGGKKRRKFTALAASSAELGSAPSPNPYPPPPPRRRFPPWAPCRPRAEPTGASSSSGRSPPPPPPPPRLGPSLGDGAARARGLLLRPRSVPRSVSPLRVGIGTSAFDVVFAARWCGGLLEYSGCACCDYLEKI